jgi:hypothetical protein
MQFTARHPKTLNAMLSWLTLFLSCGSIIAGESSLFAGDPPGTPASSEVVSKPSNDTAAPATSNVPAKKTIRLTERQRKAYIGMFALVGIAIVGLALLALTMLWGRRLRRQFRQPVPECELPARDFWFLKPAKPTVAESSLPDSHLPPHEPPPRDRDSN